MRVHHCLFVVMAILLPGQAQGGVLTLQNVYACKQELQIKQLVIQLIHATSEKMKYFPRIEGCVLFREVIFDQLPQPTPVVKFEGKLLGTTKAYHGKELWLILLPPYSPNGGRAKL